ECPIALFSPISQKTGYLVLFDMTS
ncbi:MAG: hypothetical protein QOG73_385, partial [Acetobacteraceae bacterium]|nr:hypothetical protein [Acetobacteraceae bacterium]